MSSRRLLITVGTTEFNELLQSLDNDDFLQSLQRNNYQRETLQMGRGNYRLQRLTADYAWIHYHIHVESYAFKDSLLEDMRASDLVIGHAGAGTVLEVIVILHKPMIIVVNNTLQDNHQSELANALQQLQKHGHNSNRSYVITESEGVAACLDSFTTTASAASSSSDRGEEEMPGFPITQSAPFCAMLEALVSDL